MRLVVTGWFLAVAGVASTTMMSFVDGFSIQDLQNYQKAPKGLGSPHSGLLLSQPQSPFRMETTRRDTIQMPSQTPMVPWKVSVWVCVRFSSVRRNTHLGLAVPLSLEARGFVERTGKNSLPYCQWCISHTRFFVLVLRFVRHLVPMWLNSSISIRPCTGIGP